MGKEFFETNHAIKQYLKHSNYSLNCLLKCIPLRDEFYVDNGIRLSKNETIMHLLKEFSK
jgi:hypothetical protein